MTISEIPRVLDSRGVSYALIGGHAVIMRVPRVSDLILLKLAAGGHHDLRDASILLEISDRQRVIEEVETHLEVVRPDVRETWKQLLISA